MILTFSQVFKYNLFPLTEILKEILAMGKKAMGCPVEIEFAVDLNHTGTEKPKFAILQIRPRSSCEEMMQVGTLDKEIGQAVCVSTQALGNTVNRDMADIVYVRPDTFDPARTLEIACEIGQINTTLQKEGRKYMLIGPGRWGSADRWLGIPVRWFDAEIVEKYHFWMDTNYFRVFQERKDSLDWKWLLSLPVVTNTPFVSYVKLHETITLKIDGRHSLGVVIHTLEKD